MSELTVRFWGTRGSIPTPGRQTEKYGGNTTCVELRHGGTRIVLDAGSAWYLRLSDPHSVVNNGSADRVHMVIDATVNPWIETLFDSALRTGS